MSTQAKGPGTDRANRESWDEEVVSARHNSTATDLTSTAVTPEHIPAALREYPHWVVWRYVLNPDKGKPDKVPFNPRTGSHAKTDDPETWGTLEEALAALNKPYSNWSGIGFCFSPEDPFTGIDLDGVEDVAEWVERFDSYAEYSPSGVDNRVHIITRGALPAGSRNKHNGYEVYSQGRFFTVTGHQVAGTPDTINGRQKVLEEFLAEKFPVDDTPRNTAPAGESHLEDDELIQRIRASKQGPKFDRLMSGDWSNHPDEKQSGAEGSLTMLLAFWTNRDPVQMDRIFRRSGLMRDKWDNRRIGAETYGEYTIRRAIEKTTETYDPGPEMDWDRFFNPPEDSASAQIEPPPECAQRVRELEAENRSLRAEVTRLKRVENLYSLQWQVIANPELSATNKIIALATLNEIEHAPKSRRDEQGRVAVWRKSIADRAGVTEETVSRTHKGVLADTGLFDLDVETVKVEKVNQETGEIHEFPTQQWYIRATAEPVELLERMRGYVKPESAPKHGGRRTKIVRTNPPTGCPEHPDAGTHWIGHCMECDQQVDQYWELPETDEAAQRHHERAQQIKDPKRYTSDTPSRQVVAMRDDSPPTVDSPLTQQLAATGDVSQRICRGCNHPIPNAAARERGVCDECAGFLAKPALSMMVAADD